jgi:hypothetical protein
MRPNNAQIAALRRMGRIGPRGGGVVAPVMQIPRVLDFAGGSSSVAPTLFARADGAGGLIAEHGESWSEGGTGDSPTASVLANGDKATVYAANQKHHTAQTVAFAQPGTADYFACMGLVLPSSLTSGVGRYFGSKVQLYNVSTSAYAVLAGSSSVVSSGSFSAQAGNRCVLSLAGNRDGSQRFYVNNAVIDTDNISAEAAEILHAAKFCVGGLAGTSTANTFSVVFMGLWQPADIGSHDQASLVASIVSAWGL